MSVRREGKLNNIAAKVENGVRRGLIEGGMLIAQRATRKAPRDTGRLKRSITRGQPYASGPNRWAIDVGTNVIYAATQEFGATIRPVKAKALSVPIGDLKGSPRQHDLTMVKPAGSHPLLVDAMGKAQYVLVSQVTIPAHPYLRPALNESRGDVRSLLLSSVVGSLRTI